MIQRTPTAAPLPLHEADETLWLERTAELLRAGRCGELDREPLAEYLDYMAKKDRSEVESRLQVLLMHLLKWEVQTDHRSRSWRTTIGYQRDVLQRLLESGTLRNHAEANFGRVLEKACRSAEHDTGIPAAVFREAVVGDLDAVLTDEPEPTGESESTREEE